MKNNVNRFKFSITKITETNFKKCHSIRANVFVTYSGNYVTDLCFIKHYFGSDYNKTLLLANLELSILKHYYNKSNLMNLLIIAKNIKSDLEFTEIFLNTRKFLKKKIKEQYTFINDKRKNN